MGKASPVAKSYTQADQDGPVSTRACMSVFVGERERGEDKGTLHLCSDTSLRILLHFCLSTERSCASPFMSAVLGGDGHWLIQGTFKYSHKKANKRNINK